MHDIDAMVPPWRFRGADVAREDSLACGAQSRKGYYCTLLSEHDGKHIAHTFRESGPKAGQPDGIVDEWIDKERQPAVQAPAHVRVGVGIFVIRGSSILMELRKGSHGAGTWSIPGGHLERGEGVALCAARELAEETGILLLGTPVVLDAWTHTAFEDGREYITLYAASRVDPECKVSIEEPEKCAELRWVPIDCGAPSVLSDGGPGPLFPPLANVLTKYPGILSVVTRLP